MLLKRWGAALLVLSMILTLAACNPQPATSPSVGHQSTVTKGDKKNPQGELRLPLLGEPVVFNPILTADTASSEINSYIYEGLYHVNEQLEWIPRLAKEMPEVSSDGHVWEVALRDDVKWHDGFKFTAADVAYLYDALLSPDYSGPRVGTVSALATVEVVNDYQVRFTLKEPSAPFISALSYGILPSHLFAENPVAEIKDNPANMKPVGTGPFKFAEWNKGQSVILKGNTDYWGEGPYIKGIRFKQLPDSTAALASLEANEIDYANIPADDLARVRQQRATMLEFQQFEVRGYEFLGINMENPIFQDLRVRQALTYGLDRDKIIRDVRQGFARKMNSIYPSTSWAYSDQIRDVKYDAAKANQLLEEADWKKGADGFRYHDGQKLAFKITVDEKSKSRIAATLIAQANWKELGIDAQLDVMEWSTMLSTQVYTGRYEVMAMGWSLGVDPDPYNMWHSSQANKREDGSWVGLNQVAYRNPDADALIEQGRTETDQKARAAIYRQLSDLIADDFPYVFLYQPIANVGLNKRVLGLTKGLDGFYFWERCTLDPSIQVK